MSSYKVINEFGHFSWYKEGTKILHREDGPAIELDNGGKIWYINGLRHREGGPAVEYSSGAKYWFKDDLCHREDGPACEYANGDKLWYYNGKLINCNSQEEFLRLIKLKSFW